MMNALETHVTYVPFSEIVREDRHYFFRSPNPAALEMIKAELLRFGQRQPVAVEEVTSGKFSILDGYRRADAIAKIHEEGGAWEKILVQIFPPHSLSPVQKFNLLKQRNGSGDGAYGVQERGVWFKVFLREGLTVPEIAESTGLTGHQVEDHAELADTDAELAALLNATPIDATFSVMLARRFHDWKRGPCASQALRVARTLLHHAQTESLTMKSWRFLLDFYWQDARPFMG